MSGAGSERPTFVALIGAPRSGTTWLQSLLASHDSVVSPQETNLFSRYVAPLDERWRYEARGTVRERQQRRFAGLGAVFTDEQFRDEIRGFVDDVLGTIGELKPSASIVVEKTPSHSLHVDLVARYVPGARFLHIVRDGRDVATSLVAASQGWGAAWGAPPTVGAAARVWRKYVEGARTARSVGPYHELRYEELRGGAGIDAPADAPAILQAALTFCGVTVDRDDAAGRLERFALDEQRSGERGIVLGGEAARHESAAQEPEGFFRRGHVGTWHDWSTRDRVEFDEEAGALLHELGYAADDAWLGDPTPVRRARRAVAARQRVARVQRALASRLVQSAARIEP